MTAHGAAQELLGGLVTTEAQIAATIAVVLTALAVATVVVPRVLNRIRGSVREHVDVDDALVPVPLGPVVRTLQTGITFLATLAVLVV